MRVYLRCKYPSDIYLPEAVNILRIFTCNILKCKEYLYRIS